MKQLDKRSLDIIAEDASDLCIFYVATSLKHAGPIQHTQPKC
jgi:hypothetical protein